MHQLPVAGPRLRRGHQPLALLRHRIRPEACSAPAGLVSSLLKRSGATAAGHKSHRLLRVPPAGCSPFRNRMRGMMLRGAARAREPALLTNAAMDGGAKSASRERRAGRPKQAEKTHRLKTCATGWQRGAARAREPALLTSAAMDGGAKLASSERRPGRQSCSARQMQGGSTHVWPASVLPT